MGVRVEKMLTWLPHVQKYVCIFFVGEDIGPTFVIADTILSGQALLGCISLSKLYVNKKGA